MAESKKQTPTTNKERFFHLLEYFESSRVIKDYIEVPDLLGLIKEAYAFTHKEFGS